MTDPSGKICRFVVFVQLLMAKVVNVCRGRWESMWAAGCCSIVRLETADDILDKIIYCLENPSRAELVRSWSAWPGLWLGPCDLGKPINAARPEKYFRRKGRTPKRLKLEMVKPPGFDHLTDEEFADLVAARLKEKEDAKAAEMRTKGKRYMGPSAILRQNWNAAPKTPAPRRQLNPHIAAKDPQVRIAALKRLKGFWNDYPMALKAWRAGKRRTRFPAGTYLMRILFGVRCQPLMV